MGMNDLNELFVATINRFLSMLGFGGMGASGGGNGKLNYKATYQHQLVEEYQRVSRKKNKPSQRLSVQPKSGSKQRYSTPLAKRRRTGSTSQKLPRPSLGRR